ncbi:unnamed protein product [Boreogadus saida]
MTRSRSVTATQTTKSRYAAKLDKAVSSLDWLSLLGNWESVEPGKGSFPSLKDFRYTEDLHFAQMGQPIINLCAFNASDAETKKILHRECGFIRMQTGTNRVAFIIAQNSGLVEVEEGELVGKEAEPTYTSSGQAIVCQGAPRQGDMAALSPECSSSNQTGSWSRLFPCQRRSSQ